MAIVKSLSRGSSSQSINYTSVIGGKASGKSRPVLILGKSGTGKSFAMRNLNPKTTFIINVVGKDLPFKGADKRFVDGVNMICSDDYSIVISQLNKLKSRKDITEIVIDDWQYLMADEFMKRSYEKGYDKFTEIGRHAWDILFLVKELGAGKIIYLLAHSDDSNDSGTEKCKTIGRMLDEKVVVEGLFTIVLSCVVDKGNYRFLTVNNGRNTVKAPPEMFTTDLIPNDLASVSKSIRAFYN
jgi:hypothetical protein